MPWLSLKLLTRIRLSSRYSKCNYSQRTERRRFLWLRFEHGLSFYPRVTIFLRFIYVFPFSRWSNPRRSVLIWNTSIFLLLGLHSESPRWQHGKDGNRSGSSWARLEKGRWSLSCYWHFDFGCDICAFYCLARKCWLWQSGGHRNVNMCWKWKEDEFNCVCWGNWEVAAVHLWDSVCVRCN